MVSQPSRGVEVRRSTSAPCRMTGASRSEAAADHAGARHPGVRRGRVRSAQRDAPAQRIRHAAVGIVVPAEQARTIAGAAGVALAVVDDAALLIRAGLPPGALSLALALRLRFRPATGGNCCRRKRWNEPELFHRRKFRMDTL